MRQRREQLAQTAGGLLGVIQYQIQVAIGKVRRHEVKAVVVRALDQRLQFPFAAHERLTAPFDLGLDAVVVAGRPLRVQVPDQRLRAFARGQIGQIHGGGGLSDPAFDVVTREHRHDPLAC